MRTCRLVTALYLEFETETQFLGSMSQCPPSHCDPTTECTIAAAKVEAGQSDESGSNVIEGKPIRV